MIYPDMLIATTTNVLQNSNSIITKIAHDIFNGRSLLILLLSVLSSWIAGKLVAGLLHHISLFVSKRADNATDLAAVKRFRRIETLLILSMALVRGALMLFGLYLWWSVTHAGQEPSALIGASALLLLILSNLISPIFRDLALGGGMMAEQWFGVGDLVTIQPFDVQGVVERVTLRSTKVKRLSGETVWVSNQNIAMVEVASKGVQPIALELFVADKARAEILIERVNNLLPQGPSLVVSPLTMMRTERNAPGIWHVTAIGETAPGRDYLLDQNAVTILKEADAKSKKPVLLAVPIARFADNQAERQFARAINNARKTRRDSRKLANIVRSKL